MSPDPATRDSRLRENQAEAKLAILRNRVEQHLSAVGTTPPKLIARSQDAVTTIEKILAELTDCADGNDDIDLRAKVEELGDNFRVVRARQRWHDQQVEAFAPLRDALKDTAMPESDA